MFDLSAAPFPDFFVGSGTSGVLVHNATACRTALIAESKAYRNITNDPTRLSLPEKLIARLRNAAIAEELAFIDEQGNPARLILVRPGYPAATGIDLASFDLVEGKIYIIDAKASMRRSLITRFKTGPAALKRLEAKTKNCLGSSPGGWCKELLAAIDSQPDPIRTRMLDAVKNGRIDNRFFKWKMGTGKVE